jgi:hypothetical protein
MGHFDLILQTGTSLHAYGEPDEFTAEYTVVIRHTRDRDGKAFRVGKLHAYRVHAELALNHGESLFDVCDAHSQGLHNLYAAVYDSHDNDFKKAIVDQFEAVQCDCLFIDYIVLHPRWRGLRLGLLALRKFIDLAGGGCGLTVTHIRPLSPHAHASLNVPVAWLPCHDRKEAVRKLRRHFKRMGFERINHTPYHGLSMARLTPTVADLLKARDH